MKKVIAALVVLIFAQTVQALDVWCECDANLVTIGYSGAMAGPSPVRAFALDITLSGDRTFSHVTCLSHQSGYHIYPGSIQIDASGNVTDWGSCRCSGDYPGTLDASNAMTIEMASAYQRGVDPDPCDCGDLVSFRVSGTGPIDVTISVNEIRGGIVNEDASITTPSITECDPFQCNPPLPTCWDELYACGGQMKGDVNCDGGINFVDLGRLKIAFFSSKGQPNYDCCADFNHDNGVNFLDLGILKVYFFTSGHTPATGNQDCPP
jgi:hypothetical protein